MVLSAAAAALLCCCSLADERRVAQDPAVPIMVRLPLMAELVHKEERTR